MRPDERRRPAGRLTAAQTATEGSGHSVRDHADEPVQLTEDDARWITTQLQMELDTLQWTVHKVLELVEKARAGQAHMALGYPSWTAYIVAEFGQTNGGPKTKMARADRRTLVEQLSRMGMSTRAIAPLVGVDQATVSRDLPRDADASPDDDDHDRHVVGLDGKNYPRANNVVEMPERKSRRSPLPDAYWQAVYELRKAVERLARIHADDRFASNRKGIMESSSGRDVTAVAADLADLVLELRGTDR